MKRLLLLLLIVPKLYYCQAESNPKFVGGMQKLYEYMGKNIRYPEIAKENGIQGTVYVQFVVWKDGTIRDVKVLKVLNYLEKKAEDVKTDIRNVKYEIENREIDKSYLSFFQFIKKIKTQKSIEQLKNQQITLENRLVNLKSMLETQKGHHPNYKPIKDEAIRVIKAMPKWIPAKQRGKAVNARFTVPIKFRIS